jgi:hypothetical protein
MCQQNTIGEIQKIAERKEILRFKERHHLPLPLLKSMYKYHMGASGKGADFNTEPGNVSEIFKLHQEYASAYQEAIAILEELGGIELGNDM